MKQEKNADAHGGVEANVLSPVEIPRLEETIIDEEVAIPLTELDPFTDFNKRDILAIDIGGSFIKSGVINADKHSGVIITKFSSIKTPTDSFHSLKNVIQEIISSSKEFGELDIAISTMGLVDENGVVVLSHARPWYKDISWEDELQNKPVFDLLNDPFSNYSTYHSMSGFLNHDSFIKVINDGKASTIGEYSFLKNTENTLTQVFNLDDSSSEYEEELFINFIIGTGLGYGAIYKNQLSDYHHEVIESIASKYNIRCECDNDTCPKLGSHAIIHIYELTTNKKLSIQEISSLVQEGDEEAINAFTSVGKNLGKKIGGSIKETNATDLVIGGGMINISNELAEMINYNPYLGMAFKTAEEIASEQWDKTNIKESKLGNDAVLIGAAINLVREIY